MESTNNSKNTTLGLLENLKIKIGQFEFYIQAQVVEEALYAMLLGCPFMTLCQAGTRHFTNRDSQITLVDPNTHAVITIPTFKHSRSAPSSLMLEVLGFQ